METTISKLDQHLIDQRNKEIADFKANVSEITFDRVMETIQVLEAKGVKTEISVHFERYDNHYSQTFIGFKKGEFVWDWFKVIDFEFREGDKNDYRGSLWFEHSYSQNTGKVEKGLMWGINTKNTYKKRFDVELDKTY